MHSALYLLTSDLYSVVLNSLSLNILSTLCCRAKTERQAQSRGRAQGSAWGDETKRSAKSSALLKKTSLLHLLLFPLHLLHHHLLLICLLHNLLGKATMHQHQPRTSRGKQEKVSYWSSHYRSSWFYIDSEFRKLLHHSQKNTCCSDLECSRTRRYSLSCIIYSSYGLCYGNIDVCMVGHHPPSVCIAMKRVCHAVHAVKHS